MHVKPVKHMCVIYANFMQQYKSTLKVATIGRLHVFDAKLKPLWARCMYRILNLLLRTILWRVNQHLEKNKFSERVNSYNKSNKRRLKTMDIPAWLCLFFQYLPCLLFVPQQAVKTLPHFQYLDKINKEVARWGHSNLHKNCHGGLRYTQPS